MMRDPLSRRRFLFRLGTVSLAGIASLTVLSPLGGCGGEEKASDSAASSGARDATASGTPDPCNDLSGLTEAQIETREMYEYVAESEVPEELCRDCEFWKAPDKGATCGGCTLMAGPIAPDGWCNTWSEAT